MEAKTCLKFSCFFVLSVFVFNPQAEASPPALLLSEDGGFAIAMPGKPIIQESTHKSMAGNVVITTYIYRDKTGEYFAAYVKLPAMATFFLSDKGLLKKAKKSFLKNKEATEIEARPLLLDKYKGHELVYRAPFRDTNQMAEGKVRFYIVKRFLHVIGGSTTKASRNKTIQRYLDSFELRAE